MPRSPGRGSLGSCFHEPNSSVPSWAEGQNAQPRLPAHTKCPSLPEKCGARRGGTVVGACPSPGLTPAGRWLAGRAPGSSPGPGSPAPRAEGSPTFGRARRRPMSSLAVSGSRAGSARLALGTRWAAAGGAWGVLAPGWARLVAG